MRHLLIAFVLVVFQASLAHSQAGDPDAIDFSQRMDTIVPVGDVFHARNLGPLDQDKFAEAGFTGVIRIGGPWLFDSSKEFRHDGIAKTSIDFDLDGWLDVISAEGAPSFYLHLNQKMSPFISAKQEVYFGMKSFDVPSGQVIGIADYDGDGIEEIISTMGSYLQSDLPSYVVVYSSSISPTVEDVIYPTDSLAIHKPGEPFFIDIEFGHMTPDAKPTIFLSRKDTNDQGQIYYEIGLIPNNGLLHQSEIVWISRSDEGGPIAKVMHAYDITNDGIDDLLVTDGDSVFIYKGGEGFGTYKLTRENAFFVIRSPIWDSDQWPGLRDFGGTIQACGDLSGAGIPYVMLTASTGWPGEEAGFAFFYAGGKALDSKYDAMVKLNSGTIRGGDSITVDESGRTACMLLHDKNGGNVAYLLHNGTEKIPHKTNPQMSVRQSDEQKRSLELQLTAGLAKIRIGSSRSTLAQLELFDVLGHLHDARAVELVNGTTETQLTLHGLVNGVYLLKVTIESQVQTLKFHLSR